MGSVLLNKQTRQILGKVRIHYEQEETTYPPHASNWAWLSLTPGKQAASDWVPRGSALKIAAGSIKLIQTGVKANTIANREPQRRLGRCAKQTAGDCLHPRQIFSPFIFKPPPFLAKSPNSVWKEQNVESSSYFHHLFCEDLILKQYLLWLSFVILKQYYFFLLIPTCFWHYSFPAVSFQTVRAQFSNQHLRRISWSDVCWLLENRSTSTIDATANLPFWWGKGNCNWCLPKVNWSLRMPLEKIGDGNVSPAHFCFEQRQKRVNLRHDPPQSLQRTQTELRSG